MDSVCCSLSLPKDLILIFFFLCFPQRDLSLLGRGDWPGERAGPHQVGRLHACRPGSEAAHRPR